MKEVPGNVDFSSGDIIFNGGVKIQGNVLSGFTIIADGDVDIGGVVEGATIKANGNIIISGGIQGNDKAFIQSKGNLTARFIERATVDCDGKIITDSIMHSSVKSGDSIEMVGKYSRIAGGTVVAKNYISAKTIGANVSVKTIIEVGNNPGVMEDYNHCRDEFNSIKTEYDKQGQIVKLLTEQYKKNEITEERKALLLRTVHARKFNKEKMLELQQQIEEMVQILETNRGMIKASNYVRAGVKVVIGNAQMIIDDDIPCCTLVNQGGNVVIRSY
jgi:hypothetical protein